MLKHGLFVAYFIPLVHLVIVVWLVIQSSVWRAGHGRLWWSWSARKWNEWVD